MCSSSASYFLEYAIFYYVDTAFDSIELLGGLNIIMPSLLVLLVPALPAEPLVSHLRLVDKFSINPPTTYISNVTLTKLRERQDVIEYRQANLRNPGKCGLSNDLFYDLYYSH
jgi:hypothetical protein